MLFTLWGQYYHVTLCCFHYEVNIITWHYVEVNIVTTMWGQYKVNHVTLWCSQYEVNIITWHYVVHNRWSINIIHVRSILCCSHYEVNIIMWHNVFSTMRSILSRDIMLFHTMRSILSRDIMLFTILITWHYVVQYYHVTLCCSHYEVNIITWHYVVSTMRSILSRDFMLFTIMR